MCIFFCQSQITVTLFLKQYRKGGQRPAHTVTSKNKNEYVAYAYRRMSEKNIQLKFPFYLRTRQVSGEFVLLTFNPLPDDKILDKSKMKQSADDNFKFHENSRKFS